MSVTDFIATPINTETHKNHINYDLSHNWERRARKLQDRRWRKLTNKMAVTEEAAHLKVKHFHFI